MCGPLGQLTYSAAAATHEWVSGVCGERRRFYMPRDDRRPNEIAQFGEIKKSAGNGIKQPLRCVISKCGAPKSISHTRANYWRAAADRERACTLGKSICLACLLLFDKANTIFVLWDFVVCWWVRIWGPTISFVCKKKLHIYHYCNAFI